MPLIQNTVQTSPASVCVEACQLWHMNLWLTNAIKIVDSPFCLFLMMTLSLWNESKSHQWPF